MFLLFINDLPDYVKSCNVRLFAYHNQIAYCIGESIGHQTCNRFRTICIIYFSGNKTGKWSSIPASISFYVSPTNVSHLPEITIYMDTYQKKWNRPNTSGLPSKRISAGITTSTKKANSTRAFIQRNLNHCPRDEIHLLFNACKTVA